MKAKILVVADEESIRFTFNIFLSKDGCEVSTAAGCDEAVELIKKAGYELIFADIVMDRKTGIDLLKAARQLRPATPVVMITGVPSIETATNPCASAPWITSSSRSARTPCCGSPRWPSSTGPSPKKRRAAA